MVNENKKLAFIFEIIYNTKQSVAQSLDKQHN